MNHGPRLPGAERPARDWNARHYGLLVGDRVSVRFAGSGFEATISRLHETDNNGATATLDDGQETKVVCEWCDLLARPVPANADK